MRQDPVLPSDIKLIREVMEIIDGFDVVTLEEIQSKSTFIFASNVTFCYYYFKIKKNEHQI